MTPSENRHCTRGKAELDMSKFEATKYESVAKTASVMEEWRRTA
jgi:hypothetical protein